VQTVPTVDAMTGPTPVLLLGGDTINITILPGRRHDRHPGRLPGAGPMERRPPLRVGSTRRPCDALAVAEQ
jgi:hypothetical protein